MTAQSPAATADTLPRTSYDDVPYESNPFPQTHPDHLATLATLFGMDPAPPQGARVLELGCASGGNIIPYAVSHPHATVLGVDLSARQVDTGRSVIEALGLRNIELRHASITDIGAAEGEFDYIISHGVYSWVPDEVQRHILQVCASNLAKNGVAYISYNTYPGWHMRGMVRDMMCYHTRQFTDPPSQIAQARALLEFLSANASQAQDNAYGTLLKSESDMLRKQGDYYLFHDHLEEVNSPIYFHDFVERAAGAGLQFLAESDFSTMLASNFPPEVAQTLHKVAPDIIRMEQYMDFLRNRQFRQSLLVHQDVALKRNLGPDEIMRFYVASPAERVDSDDKKASIKSNDEQQFKTAIGTSITTRRPLFKAAMSILIKNYPAFVHFDTLLAKSMHAITGEKAGDDVLKQAGLVLGQDLLQAFSAKLVEFRLTPALYAPKPPAKPRATPLARRQAEHSRIITSLRHQNVTLDEFGRHLVLLLDGERDAGALAKALCTQVMAGVLRLERDGNVVTDQAEVDKLIGEGVSSLLANFARMGLLLAPTPPPDASP